MGNAELVLQLNPGGIFLALVVIVVFGLIIVSVVLSALDRK